MNSLLLAVCALVVGYTSAYSEMIQLKSLSSVHYFPQRYTRMSGTPNPVAVEYSMDIPMRVESVTLFAIEAWKPEYKDCSDLRRESKGMLEVNGTLQMCPAKYDAMYNKMYSCKGSMYLTAEEYLDYKFVVAACNGVPLDGVYIYLTTEPMKYPTAAAAPTNTALPVLAFVAAILYFL